MIKSTRWSNVRGPVHRLVSTIEDAILFNLRLFFLLEVELDYVPGIRMSSNSMEESFGKAFACRAEIYSASSSGNCSATEISTVSTACANFRL